MNFGNVKAWQIPVNGTMKEVYRTIDSNSRVIWKKEYEYRVYIANLLGSPFMSSGYDPIVNCTPEFSVDKGTTWVTAGDADDSGDFPNYTYLTVSSKKGLQVRFRYNNTAFTTLDYVYVDMYLVPQDVEDTLATLGENGNQMYQNWTDGNIDYNDYVNLPTVLSGYSAEETYMNAAYIKDYTITEDCTLYLFDPEYKPNLSWDLPDSVTVEADGETMTSTVTLPFTVTADSGLGWNAYVVDDLSTYTYTSEYGGYVVNGTVGGGAESEITGENGTCSDYTLGFNSNTDTDARTFYLVLESINEEGTPVDICKVIQKGKTVKTAPSWSPSTSITSSGGSATFTVTDSASAGWKLTSVGSWLAFSPSSGTGTTTVTRTAEANPTTSSRSSVATLIRTDLNTDVSNKTFTQSAASSSTANQFSLSKDSAEFDAAGDSTSVTVTSTSSWTATANASWISLSSTSGSSTATITISADANAGLKTRTGTVTFTSGSKTLTFSVSQAADITIDVGNSVITSFNKSTGVATFIVSPATVGSNWTIAVTLTPGVGAVWPTRVLDNCDIFLSPTYLTESKTYSGRKEVKVGLSGNLSGSCVLSYSIAFTDETVNDSITCNTTSYE
jgi:hypothetical protein